MANSVTCNFYSFAKKDNSTIRPTGQGTIRRGEFKTGFELLAPVIKLADPGSDPPVWNYVYIAKLSRYYFIRSWSYDAGFWYASTAIDALATWKTEIGQQSLYVTRSASSYDGSIIDGAYPTTAECDITYNSTYDEPFGGGGCFVVGVVGGSNSVGAISYYAMSGGSFATLIGYLLGDNQYMNIDPDELSAELQKAFINPSQYIASCLWIPVDAGSVPGSAVGSIPVGWWSFAVGAVKIDPLSAKVGGQYALAIPKHPLAATRGKYLNLGPYSDYTVTIFPFGTFTIDPMRLQDQSTLNLRAVMDCCTGEAVLYITCDGAPIKVVNGRYGVPVPTGQISYQITSFSGAATAAGMAAAAGAGAHSKEFLTKDKILGYLWSPGRMIANEIKENRDQVKAAANDIISTAISALANVDYSGQMGSNIYGVVPVSITGKFLELVAEDLPHQGRPLCQIVTLNTLSGYLQVADADIEIACTATEREIIISYLLGGMFYE